MDTMMIDVPCWIPNSALQLEVQAYERSARRSSLKSMGRSICGHVANTNLAQRQRWLFNAVDVLPPQRGRKLERVIWCCMELPRVECQIIGNIGQPGARPVPPDSLIYNFRKTMDPRQILR